MINTSMWPVYIMALAYLYYTLQTVYTFSWKGFSVDSKGKGLFFTPIHVFHPNVHHQQLFIQWALFPWLSKLCEYAHDWLSVKYACKTFYHCIISHCTNQALKQTHESPIYSSNHCPWILRAGLCVSCMLNICAHLELFGDVMYNCVD